MAKKRKKAEKKVEPVKIVGSIGNEKRLDALERRIDRLVVALDKSKSVRGL